MSELPWFVLSAGLALLGCSNSTGVSADEVVQVGALLPFSGRETALGANLEQAMLLAAEDINRAGGVYGKPIHLLTRDSNSGSERGLNELLWLLYEDQVAYLIGPEEAELTNEVVPDLKALDVLNVLPGYSAPIIERTSAKGAWLRLAPTPAALGCGLAQQVFADGAQSANALIASDDFNNAVATEFAAQFQGLGGAPLPSVTLSGDPAVYAAGIDRAMSFGSDRTLLLAYPSAAAKVVTEWTVAGRRGAFQLSPSLHADGFLLNSPYGAVDGLSGLSPSLALSSECQALDSEQPHLMSCTYDNARAFADHFAARWSGDRPFPAAHFYYDAVILLAMGIQYQLSTSSLVATAARVRNSIRALNAPGNPALDWRHLDDAMARLAAGRLTRYVGAAAEYDFDAFGSAKHAIFDTWGVVRQTFVDTGSLHADCTWAL